MIGRVVEPNGKLLNPTTRLYDEKGTLISEYAAGLDRQFAIGGR